MGLPHRRCAKLLEAMEAVEGVVAGRLVAVATNLSPSHVRRVVPVEEAP